MKTSQERVYFLKEVGQFFKVFEVKNQIFAKHPG